MYWMEDIIIADYSKTQASLHFKESSNELSHGHTCTINLSTPIMPFGLAEAR